MNASFHCKLKKKQREMMLYIIFRTPQQVKREVLSTDLIIPGELLEIFFFRTFEFFQEKPWMQRHWHWAL